MEPLVETVPLTRSYSTATELMSVLVPSRKFFSVVKDVKHQATYLGGCRWILFDDTEKIKTL